MAAVVDGQNTGDVNYINMTGNYTGFAFKAALDLIMNGRDIANGYTGPTLHHWRKFCKTAQH